MKNTTKIFAAFCFLFFAFVFLNAQVNLVQNGCFEIYTQCPTLKSTPSNLQVNYAEIVVPLVKAVQELSHKVDSLLGVTQGTGQRKAQTGNNNGSTVDSVTKVSTIHVQLSNINSVVLNQNQPNPFAEQTVITYSIPQTANSAQILFYDMNGKQINSVTITAKGAGQLNVYANDLSNGTYSYTLIVDGTVMDTKKMVKQ